MMVAEPDGDAAEPLVDVIIEDARWHALGLEDLARRAVLAVLAVLELSPVGYSLCVMGCDDARMAALNGAFRGKGRATNVLSWPLDDLAIGPGVAPRRPEPGPGDDPAALGDIALAYETCTAEALAQGKAAADHVTHLIVHGVLHLLGYDHIDDADAAMMEALEVRVLAPLGISDPY